MIPFTVRDLCEEVIKHKHVCEEGTDVIQINNNKDRKILALWCFTTDSTEET